MTTPFIRAISRASGVSSTEGQVIQPAIAAAVPMPAGTPVCAIANRLHPADNITNFRVIGILASDVAAEYPGVVVYHGLVSIPGLLSGYDYYLGNGVIQTTPPTSGRVIQVGTAITESMFNVNVRVSILL